MGLSDELVECNSRSQLDCNWIALFEVSEFVTPCPVPAGRIYIPPEQDCDAPSEGSAMGDNTVIRLDDVRRLKAAGLRLNPPVSEGYNAAWTALTASQAAFLLAVEAYSDSDRSATKWWSVRRRLAGVDRAMTGCLKFLAELEGDWIGDGKLTFESEQAAREYRLLKRFILNDVALIPRFLE